MKQDQEYEELKGEISKLRVELKQRLDNIDGQLNKQIKLNYSRTTVDYLLSFTNNFIDSMKCEYEPGFEKTCKERMQLSQQEYIDLLRSGKLSESLMALDRVIETSNKIKETLKTEGKGGCVKCFEGEINGLEINKVLLSQLSEIESPNVATDENKLLIDEIEPAEVDEKFLNPLSHQSRLSIMLSIYRGENRFTDFMEKTGFNGGHLIYHLKILEDSGLIRQFASKEYVLTSKGLNCLVMIANLNSILK